jgi:hypothetical protein
MAEWNTCREGIWDIIRDVRTLAEMIFIIGVGLLLDTFRQVVNYYRTGYSDKYLHELVIDAIITFTTGYIIVAGLVLYVLYFNR